MSNKDTLIQALKRLYAELDTVKSQDAMPVWVEMGKCFLLAEELLSKADYEELLNTVFTRRIGMRFSTIEQRQDTSRNFIHHYLESVEKRIQKRDKFYTQRREMYDVTSLGNQ